MSKLFEIFKAGKYPQGDYPEAKVKAIFENYDPAWWQAPFTVEHAKSGPAFGYVTKLEFADGKLLASTDDINAELRDMIAKKHFGPVSVEIFREVEKDGKKIPYLAAVSFMGVQPPQVKGLEKVAFSEVPDQSVAPEVDRLCFRAQAEGGHIELVPMTETEIAEFTAEQESESQTVDEFAAERQQLLDQVAALTAERDDAVSKFTATDADRQVAEDRLREINMNIRRLEFESWLNEKVAYGNLVPKLKTKVLKLLMALDQVAHFSADHSGLIDEFKGLVDSYPKLIDTQPTPDKGDAPSESTSAARDLGNRALQFQQQQADQGVYLSLSQAMNLIKKES